MTEFALQPQAEWFWHCQDLAANGEPRERSIAIGILLDMAFNHEDDRLRTRAASIIALRHWGNVESIVARPEGGAA